MTTIASLKSGCLASACCASCWHPGLSPSIDFTSARYVRMRAESGVCDCLPARNVSASLPRPVRARSRGWAPIEPSYFELALYDARYASSAPWLSPSRSRTQPSEYLGDPALGARLAEAERKRKTLNTNT